MHTLAMKKQIDRGFTIVELLVVIVVIAILAAITIISYNGIVNAAKETSLKSDLRNGVTQLQLAKAKDGTYPSDANSLQKSDTTTFTYSSSGESFCLSATTNLADTTFFTTETGTITEGSCPAPAIQTITAAHCPSTRTRVVDARDNHTYWVQKLADGKCWMLTNLAYAGGGTNTYGDTKTLTNGTGGSASYTVPSYYIVPSTTNFTTEPTNPSASTDGTGQYGYLYNWCGAMGGQAGTNACLSATTPVSNPAISACPTGWRLPTGNSGEFVALNNAVNGGSTVSPTGLLTTWLGQWSSYWNYGYFEYQGMVSWNWSSTPFGVGTHAYALGFDADGVYPASQTSKNMGAAVRCVAS